MRYNYSMVNPSVMSDFNQQLVDELFEDWSLEDTPEALLDEQFFRDYRSSQSSLSSVGVTARDLDSDLRPMYRHQEELAHDREYFWWGDE